MDNNLGFNYSNQTLIHKGELFGLICLAFVGITSIVKSVADNSYKSGREAKEREIAKEQKRIRKDFKKMMKRGL